MEQYRASKRVETQKRSESLSIDHADNNIHNNTLLNLSQMKGGLNQTKGGLVARFKHPYVLNIAVSVEGYRIQFLTFGVCGINEAYSQMLFLCPTPQDCIDCLKHLLGTHGNWMDIVDSPSLHYAQNSTLPYWAGDFFNSLNAQTQLYLKNKDEFMLFKDREIILSDNSSGQPLWIPGINVPK